VTNIDKTNWKMVPNGQATWSKKETESGNFEIENDQKEGLSVIPSIDLAGEKLRLMALGKGEAQRCLKQYRFPRTV
jgi:hypothetical protein